MLDDDDLQDRIDRFDDLLNRRASPTAADEADLPALLLAEHLEDFVAGIDPTSRRRIAAEVDAYLDVFVAQEQSGDPAAPGANSKTGIPVNDADWAQSQRIVPLSVHRWDVGRRRRLFWQTLVAAAILGALVSGAAALLPQVPPTSFLYPAHQAQQRIEVLLAIGPTSKAQNQVGFAQNSLHQFENALDQNNAATYESFFTTFQSDLDNADQAVQAVPAGSDRNALAKAVESLRKQAVGALHQALPRANWANRLQATKALKTLGASVPSIQSVNVTHSSGKPGNGKPGGGTSGSGGQGNGNSGSGGAPKGLVIHVHGSGFVDGAILYINGNVMVSVTSVTSHDLEATLSGVSTLRAGTTVGVSNPDFSVAQLTLDAPVGQSSPSSQIAAQTPPEATPPPGAANASPTATPSGHQNGSGQDGN